MEQDAPLVHRLSHFWVPVTSDTRPMLCQHCSELYMFSVDADIKNRFDPTVVWLTARMQPSKIQRTNLFLGSNYHSTHMHALIKVALTLTVTSAYCIQYFMVDLRLLL